MERTSDFDGKGGILFYNFSRKWNGVDQNDGRLISNDKYKFYSIVHFDSVELFAENQKSLWTNLNCGRNTTKTGNAG